ncbi:hypothetical protein GCM10007857_44790 [Bradyrhizobium iriomotense]|uniref:Uncharacterized protein n=1 Tax=Bradyrhizobium iriomotense TaxID=441950 RepID=A0ABQ6B1T0_9BRAD|nr:hypothetical protein GCM10007857_44790 [Bradyrhizobium iriomotense]
MVSVQPDDGPYRFWEEIAWLRSVRGSLRLISGMGLVYEAGSKGSYAKR